MNSSSTYSSSHNIKAFLCGIATATISHFIYSTLHNNKENDRGLNDDNKNDKQHQHEQRQQSKKIGHRHLPQQQQQQEPSSSSSSSLPPSSKTTSSSSNSNDENDIDSPDLPLRLIRKAETAILKRTSRILVVIERCTNDFNYSAILRTVEALGVQHVWLIEPPKRSTTTMEEKDEPFVPEEHEQEEEGESATSNNNNNKSKTKKQKPVLKTTTGKVIKNVSTAEYSARCNHHLFAQNAAGWLTIREFSSTESCIEALHNDNRTIWATDLGQLAVPLTPTALAAANNNESSSSSTLPIIPTRLAIIFGTEAVGCSTTIFNACHRRVYLPLYGFADSLNLSVATALIVQQLFHLCPDAVGDMTEAERRGLREVWYAKLASQRILTSKEKKIRRELEVKIKTVDELIKRRDANGSDGRPPLQPQQLDKISRWSDCRRQLTEFDEKLTDKARRSVVELVNNPPPPLVDMRRCDEHRICYVGKGTKKKHEEDWRDMPAMGNYGTGGVVVTSDYFRERAKAAKEEN